jgi:hypothetical protein
MSKCLATLPVLFLLVLPLLGQEDEFQRVERIVAVGDVHGDFDRFVEVLRSVAIIDYRNRWIGGKTHLVQTGDVVDRGPDSRRVMDLLMQLERQAEKAGGRVHLLLGNHEAMNLYGDLRYVSPGEYAAFRSSDSEELRERAFQAYLAPILSDNGEAADLEKLRRQWNEQHPPGWVEHRQAFGVKGKYGKWLRKKNTAIKINDLLFVHAGISPKYSSWPIREINQRVRQELTDFSRLEDGIVVDSEGPLWYRALSQQSEVDLTSQVDALLARYAVKHIVVGHSPTLTAVLPRFGGKVILIDVGLSREYGGPPACLVVEHSRLKALHRGTLLDFPDQSADLLSYLKSAAALDPRPSPLLDLISGQGQIPVAEER